MRHEGAGSGQVAGSDQVNAIATKPEQSRTRPATVTARKLLEANSSRMAHHLSLENAGYRLDYCTLLEQNDCPLAQSKEFPWKRQFSAGVMISCNTVPTERFPASRPQNQPECHCGPWISLSVCANGRPRAFPKKTTVPAPPERRLWRRQKSQNADKSIGRISE